MVLYETLADADKHTRDRLETILQDGEDVELVLRNREFLLRRDLPGLGWLQSLAYRMESSERIALTDRRVIKFRAGAYQRQTTDVQLDAISQVEFDQGLKTEIEIDGSGVDLDFTPRRPDEGDEFANRLRGQLSE